MKRKIVALLLSVFMLGSTEVLADKLVLFVCGGNTGRSPMAEGLANGSHSFNVIKCFRNIDISDSLFFIGIFYV